MLSSGAGWSVGLEITDASEYHVYAPGKPFEIQLRNSGKSVIDVQWVDFRGTPLSTKATLKPGQTLGLRSPGESTGYYGLRSLDPQGQRESGFAILPEQTIEDRSRRAVKQSSPFGSVHADNRDPYLDHWTKTATWETYAAENWATAMQERRKLGMTELPIVHGRQWDTSAAERVTEEHLTQLKAALLAYFKADPLTIYWEMGIEENLSGGYSQPHYWENLEAKMRIAREAADEANPNIRFIYQVAGTDLAFVENFLSRPVAQKFSILSLHPYNWPEFENPELWLVNFLDGVHALQEKHSSNHAIWFTEIGSPQHLNPEGGLFNFGEARNVRGQSRAEAVSYMTRMVTIALHNGVEKIFWYNYRDRSNLHADPENFFGMRDFEGFPKPTYLAYRWLSHWLHSARPEKSLKLSSRIHTYRFSRRTDICAIAWTTDQKEYEVELVSLLGKQSPEVIATDMMGSQLPRNAGMIRIGNEPVLACTQTPQQP